MSKKLGKIAGFVIIVLIAGVLEAWATMELEKIKSQKQNI